MSFITDVVIIADRDDKAAIEEINNAVGEADTRHQCLAQVGHPDQHGGSKVSSLAIWAACYNYLPTQEFRLAVLDAHWHFPWRVIIYMEGEASDLEVFGPKDGDFFPT